MFEHLINSNYRYNYALVVYTTGEVYTAHGDDRHPLRLLYKRLDGLRREWRTDYHLHVALINLRTQKMLMEILD